MINKGKVLSLRKIKNVNFITQNKLLFIMCLVYIAGVLSSVIIFSEKGSIFNWSDILNKFYISRSTSGFVKTFLISLLTYISVLVVYFISGTSIMGIGITPMITFLLGFISGGISAYLYKVYSLKGIAFNALIVLPVSVIFFTVCFFAAKTSFQFSSGLSKISLKKTSGMIPVNFKAYCGNYLLLSGITVVISLADASISLIFIKIFKF